MRVLPTEYVPVLKRTKFTEARADAMTTSRLGAVRFALVISMGALYGLVAGIWRGQSRGAIIDNAVAFVAVIAVVWLVWLFRFRMKRQKYLARVVEVGRECGRCPACAYALHECFAGEDGCTVCPECGGAWNLGAGSRPKSA